MENLIISTLAARKKTILVLFLFFFSLLTANSFSQPSITWQRTYRGPNPVNNSRGNCISTQNSHFILGASGGGYLIRINNFGDTIWTRFYPDGSTTEIVSSGDGGCVFPAGTFDSAATTKVDSLGNTIWYKYYNFQGGIYKNIIKTIDGGYLVCGDDPFGAQIFKVSPNGELQWRKYFSIAGTDVTLNSAINAYNGGYMVVGTRGSQFDSTRIILFRLSSDGDTLWSKTYKIFNRKSTGVKLLQYYGKYVIFGQTSDSLANPNCNNRIYITKLDTSGNQLNSNLITNNSSEGLNDAFIIGPNKFVFSSTVLGCIDTVTGNIFLTDSIGNRIVSKSFIYPLGDVDINRLTVLNNGDVIFTGYVDSVNSNQPSIFAIRTDSILNIYPIGLIQNSTHITDEFILKQNYPNPFNPDTKIVFSIPRKAYIKIKIYNTLGQNVKNLYEGNLNKGEYSITWKAYLFSSGIYFCVLETETSILTRKMLLLK